MPSIILIIIVSILILTNLIECIHELMTLIYDSTLDRGEPMPLEAGDNEDMIFD